MAYFGTADLVSIRPDPHQAGLFYADLANYFDFDRKVPFLEGEHFYESALRAPDGTVNAGSFQRAVRNIPDDEFTRIVQAGFATVPLWPEATDASPSSGFAEDEQAPFGGARPLVTFTRPFRDRMFTRGVQRAYDRTCAVTGLRLLNGGGRPEVQAAHIQPVERNGPDSVRNGIALSGTMHWLFDRGLMTFEDDRTIRLVKSQVPSQISSLINPTGKLMVPPVGESQPSPTFLRFHRENIFKG